jgi:hypothetical protein
VASDHAPDRLRRVFGTQTRVALTQSTLWSNGTSLLVGYIEPVLKTMKTTTGRSLPG